ncbi:rab-GTPase-TBC domain-containing protein [Mortierella sp. GBAus27b]|nr:rab-GTPase-TBC domain-containing protein [Mortierella sp. GBAus27b]
MLDEILDNAVATSELLSQDLETSLNSKASGYSTSTNYAATAADRARLSRSTTLGYLLPQPKNHGKIKRPELSQSNVDPHLLHKLEEQNNLLPPQDSTSFLLARLERQNELLDTDPKAVCIESNVLKGNLSTLQRLIADSTALNSPNSTTVDPITAGSKLMEPQEGDEEIDWEFWGMLVQDYNAVARKLPHLLAARVRQGLPSKLRGLIWQSMSQASSTYLETMYTQLLKEHSPYERIIQRDLARTFPSIDMFKEEGGKGQEGLRNILKAYSLYDPHVGYCQGLGFLVGPLLMNMDEREAFCVFVRLMETYDMRTMFTLNMEGLQLRLHQFSALLSEHLPMLHAHLSFHSINPAMYASQWFLSLFAYTYPLPLVLRIFDVVFSEGAPETIMRVAVAFLRKNEDKLMQLQEFEDLLDMLSTKLYDVYDGNAGEVIRDAMTLSTEITKDKLDALAVAYVAELEDQQLRAGEVTSKRFGDRFGVSKAAATTTPVVNNTSNKQTKPKSNKGGNRLSIAASFGSSAALLLGGGASSNEDEVAAEKASLLSTSSSNTARMPSTTGATGDAMLLEQIQDLAKALSNLQREHAEVTENLVVSKMEKSQYMEEVDNLRKKVTDMERQQNRASMMSAISPSVMSNSDGASSVMSPRTITYDDARMSWSRHSQDDDIFGDEKCSSVSSLTQDEITNRLLHTERELAHVTAELVSTKESAMEAMNEAESHRTKVQQIERVLMGSKEAVVLLQEQQMVLQDAKMGLVMEIDTARHERDSYKREMEVLRIQFEETKRLWLEGQVERHQLNEKVKELEMNATFAAQNGGLSRGRSSRKSMNDTAMFGMITSRTGSSSPRASSQVMSPVCETPRVTQAPSNLERRGSTDSLESSGTRITARRGSTDTMGSLHSTSRESISGQRPAALVRKGWPSEKAANAGVVPSSAANAGSRKFVVSPESDATKSKRNSANRNSILGALSFRRSETS